MGRAGLVTRFSLRLNNDLPVRQFAELAAAADDAGFDQVWVSHDLFFRSAPVLVAAAAAATKTVQLGIGIMNPFSAHPAELAMHAATLQELSRGRFLLGLGAGAEEFLGWAGLAAAAAAGRRPRGRPVLPRAAAAAAARPRTRRCRPAGSPRRGCGSTARRCRSTWARWGRACSRSAARSPTACSACRSRPNARPPRRLSSGTPPSRPAATRTSVDVPACFWCSIDDDPERAARAAGRQARVLRPVAVRQPAQ